MVLRVPRPSPVNGGVAGVWPWALARMMEATAGTKYLALGWDKPRGPGQAFLSGRLWGASYYAQKEMDMPFQPFVPQGWPFCPLEALHKEGKLATLPSIDLFA